LFTGRDGEGKRKRSRDLFCQNGLLPTLTPPLAFNQTQAPGGEPKFTIEININNLAGCTPSLFTGRDGEGKRKRSRDLFCQNGLLPTLTPPLAFNQTQAPGGEPKFTIETNITT